MPWNPSKPDTQYINKYLTNWELHEFKRYKTNY